VYRNVRIYTRVVGTYIMCVMASSVRSSVAARARERLENTIPKRFSETINYDEYDLVGASSKIPHRYLCDIIAIQGVGFFPAVRDIIFSVEYLCSIVFCTVFGVLSLPVNLGITEALENR